MRAGAREHIAPEHAGDDHPFVLRALAEEGLCVGLRHARDLMVWGAQVPEIDIAKRLREWLLPALCRLHFQLAPPEDRHAAVQEGRASVKMRRVLAYTWPHGLQEA
eukprot:5441115-Lingulodinium_polyedra.AAC.1